MVFEILWAKAGFDSVKLGIRLREDTYRRGGNVVGELHLEGGKVAQEIRGLSIELVREWSTEHYGMDMTCAPDPLGRWDPLMIGPAIDAGYEVKGETGEDVVAVLTLGKGIRISPGEQRMFRFDLQIPKGDADEMVSTRWKLRARADIPRARDVVVESRIAVE